MKLVEEVKEKVLQKPSKRIFIWGLYKKLKPMPTSINFENPQIDRYVIVLWYKIRRNQERRTKSIKDLRRIFNSTLDNLNWRLMSEGIEYRMGYLKGRLKGYENDDELAKFIKKRDNKRPLFWDKDGPVY